MEHQVQTSKLAMQDGYFRRMFEQSHALLMVLAPDRPHYTILAVSDQYVRVTRRSRESLVGRGLFEAFPENPNIPEAESVRRVADSLSKVLDTRETCRMEVLRYDIEMPDRGFQARWWSRIDVPIFGDDGEIACILHRVEDVSELVQKNAELEAQRARAEAASTAKTEFLSSMSHELRTPLNAIVGFAQLLLRDRKEPLSPRHAERVQHVIKAGDHLVHLVDDVLDLSRIEAGRITMSLEPIAIAPVLDDVLATLSPMARAADIRITTVAPAQLPLVQADRTRLAQIVVNFGTNAIKYNRRGGHVTVRATATPTGARIAVEDDGLGIDPAHREKVFAPFERAGQEAGPIEGTGIGLAIAHRLADLMGGTVGFTSELARGSTFWLDLPRTSTPTATARPTAHATAWHDRGPGTFEVAYVEDNPANVAFMRDALSEVPGLHLVTAASAELGLPMIRERRPQLVIMDINLPGASGIEAARQLAAWPETAAIPVIALSAAATTADVRGAKAAGFRRYLTKPVQVDALLAAIDELLPTKEATPC